MKSKLSLFENAVYFCIWLCACLYSLQKLYSSQTDILEKNPNLQYTFRDLNPGWSFLQRLKDESDGEWHTWLYLMKTSWFYMFLHFFISELIRRTNVSVLKYWYIISSTIFIVNCMGTIQLLIIIVQPLVFLVLMHIGGNRISVWIVSISMLLGYNSFKSKYIWYIVDSKNYEEVFLLIYGFAWIQARCISYCHSYIESSEKQQPGDNCSQPSVFVNFLNLFSYVMYLPMLYTGPIVLYEDFKKSFDVDNSNLPQRLKLFIWNMAVYLVYTVLLELSFHYMYFCAMRSNVKIIKMLPSVALCGGGLWMGVEFHLKYVISYGTTGSYARLDHIDAPPTPRCIARSYLYSQVWRYFDVGLYKFLFMYIYIPVCNLLKSYDKIPNMINKLLSSLITFIFIFMWHGTSWSIFVWAVLNYLGIVLEFCGKAIGSSTRYAWFKEKILKTDAMEVRFISLFCTPLLIVSAVSNFYLFAGRRIGDVYFDLLISPSSLFSCVALFVSMYSSCQIAIALKDVHSRTDYTKRQKSQ